MRSWLSAAELARWAPETETTRREVTSHRLRHRSRSSVPIACNGISDRWQPISGPKTLDYEVTIDDSTVWTEPGTAMIPLMGTDDAIYEYACHEGNYGMEGILAGHRAQEKAAAHTTSGGG